MMIKSIPHIGESWSTMLYYNITPEDYVERKYCVGIYRELTKTLDDSYTLFVRSWSQKLDFPNHDKFISIVTSAEGHEYIPYEQEFNNCYGVFMHYYPKVSRDKVYSSRGFHKLEKVYPLPLGTTDFFTGTEEIPINKRLINVSFVGQLDPYRRLDFYHAIGKQAQQIEDSVFHFYEGWNNGIGNKYSEIMSNTKIALVPCGSASLDTFRYYEAAKCGCVIITQQQNDYDFLQDAPHIRINNWDNIAIMIQSLLSGPSHLNHISKNTYNFWKRKLSPEGAAKYILEKINERK